MIEWLALVVLIPVVLVPVVLLFGFAGCSLLFESAVPRKAFEITLAETREMRNRCLVQRIEPDRLAGTGDRVRLTLQRPPDSNLIIQSITISQPSGVGDPYDSAADPKLVPESYPLLVPAAEEGEEVMELKWVDFAFDGMSPLLLAFDVGDPGRMSVSETVPSTDATAFIGPVQDPPLHEALTADRQSGYNTRSVVLIVQRIDVS